MSLIGGNHITLLRNGTEYFPALEQAIHHAQRSVYLQTYIYAQDAAGTRITNAMLAAVARGVSVRVLIDGFGSQDLPHTYIEQLRQAGIDLIIYRPKISPWSLKKNRLRRLHQKVAVIDDTHAFVGGINIIDDHNVPHQVAPRVDYAVMIQGALIPIITANITKLWRRLDWMHFRKPRLPQHPHVTANIKPKGNIRAAFLTRDNILHRNDIEEAYLSAIRSAKTEIIIANAYFVPGRTFRKTLIDAAKRGVQVKLLLQGHKEYFLMFATHVFYPSFLNNGIEIYEYRKSFMHSKVAVIDQEWATVGSSNIDPLSLLLAREANVVIQDQAFAMVLHADIAQAIHNGAVKVTTQSWKKENIIKRFLSWIAYGVVRILIGLIGHAKEH